MGGAGVERPLYGGERELGPGWGRCKRGSPLWTDRHTHMKTLPSRNFVGGQYIIMYSATRCPIPTVTQLALNEKKTIAISNDSCLI